MQKLLAMAKKKSDEAEIYSLIQKSHIVRFENAKFKDIESKLQSGVSLRLIKNSKLGFAYTKNPDNHEEILQNALNSIKSGVEATFKFPYTKNLPRLDTYEPAVENLSNTRIVEECKRVYELLGQRTKGQVNVYAGTSINEIKIVNSAGTNLSAKSSSYFIDIELLYPGSYAAIFRSLNYKKFEETPTEFLNFLTDIYNRASNEINLRRGKMKVLFMPETIYVLMWRLQSATSGESIHQKQSPIAEKIGDKIFSEKLTIYDDPLNDTMPAARSFDDEGMPCQYLAIIKNGILKNFYYDLNYAKKMNKKATGHGFKSGRWAGEKISLKPNPHIQYLYIKPGKKSFAELVKSMDRGIIIWGALGAHSGNIPNGDFSIGLSPGIYVENGDILGRVKDTMIAGNIYTVMKNVSDIEDTIHPSYLGYFPAVLFDDVNVATKK